MIAGDECHTCGAHLDSALMTSCSFSKSNIVRSVSFGTKIILQKFNFRTGNEIEKAIVSFEFLVDIHADDSEFTLLRQAGPAARQILLRANHQIFRSLSPYSGPDLETLYHCVTLILTA